MRMLAQFPMMAALAALVSLVGCSDEVNIVPPDGDGDQYSAWTKEHAQSLGNVDAALKFGDCADSDPAVNPGAQEICDGKDNDCDGLTDAADDNFVMCSDTDACTDLTCSPAGQCVATATTCDDGSKCTDDSCDPMTGCATAPVTCDDGNECTTDSCDPMTGCAATPIDGACDDGDACTIDVCNSTTGACDSTAAVDCSDDNVCTTNTCDPATGCVTENNTGACDDGDTCTLDDACFGGACISTTEKNCDDDSECTDDSCDAGLCSNTAVVCDDSNACTTDSCDTLAGCKAELINCDDANPCTTDSCDSNEGCVYMNNTATCTDGNVCTVEDFCLNGACVAGAPNPCDDSNACTTDSCDPATGCGTAPVVCNDMNPCTDDSCSPLGGCIVTANTADCDDGDACTMGDKCADTGCDAGDVVDCDDGDPCTVDTCDQEDGCMYGPMPECCTDNPDCGASRPVDLPSSYIWGCTVENGDGPLTGSCSSCLDADADGYCDSPSESNCANDLDEDGDTSVDCDDTDCTMNPACIAPCESDCVGKECGDDGCGESCGDCVVGDKCDPNGQCEPEPRLMITWEAPMTGVPQNPEGNLVLLAKCYDEDGMAVVPWGVKDSGPTNSMELSWTATDWFTPVECRTQVVEVVDGSTTWYANGLYGLLSYLWDGLTVDDVAGDGSGWGFEPWDDSDGDETKDATDPCPYSGMDSCLP